MHNIKDIRNNPTKFQESLKTRFLNINTNSILDLDSENRKLIQKKEVLENEKKQISKSKDKSLFEKSKKISLEIDQLSKQQSIVKNKLEKILSEIPNLPLPDVPIGKDESYNKEIKKKGNIPQFNFTLQCNDKPNLKSDDGGVRRRIRVLTFPNKFIDNPKKPNERKLINNIDDKLEKCKDVLMWLLINVYYIKYKEWGTLKGHEPKTMLEDSAEYIDKSNTIKIFFNTKYSTTDNKNDKIHR